MIDFLSLVLQAAGGAITDLADPGTSLQDTGINIMISGLILQVVGLAVFLLVGLDFAWRCHRGVLDMKPEKVATRQRTLFKVMLAGLVLSTIVVLIRSVYRAIELWQGFGGALWNDELEFMILDGAMIATAVLALTLLHPGVGFREQWHAANWTFRSRKNGDIPMKDTRSLHSSEAMVSG